MLAVQSVERKTFRFFKPALRDASLVEPAMSYLVRLLLDDRADIPAANLSHGERRALEIAIALALKPKAFLLDEPMAGMGPENTEKLVEILDGLRAEAPILLVEHDMDAVFALRTAFPSSSTAASSRAAPRTTFAPTRMCGVPTSGMKRMEGGHDGAA